MNFYGNFNGTTGHTPATDAAQATQMLNMTRSEDALAQSQAARLLRMRQEQARMQPVDTALPTFGDAQGPMAVATAPAPAPEAAPAEEAPKPGLRLPDQKIVNRNLYNRPPKGRAARGGMTAQEEQAARDQVTLAKPFLAYNDVIQAPMAMALNAYGALGAGMYNLGGRAINAITGKPLVEADKKNPQQFGLTPFYDAARRREAEIDAARGIPRGAYQSPYPEAQKQAPAQQQQAPAPGAVARGTSQYDSVDSGYDDVIAKAATDNGIDPLVLKRLLGTESSFRPDAVSPRGESFGLGIAQIADVHGLSREAKLDPNQAIPFAAQLFAKYLKAANGDYAEAMMKYKGASSAKGRAAMQKPIAEVLGVDLTTAQAPATQPPATQETAAKAAPAQTFSPENVSRFGEQTQQAVRVAQMRISELARSARYATTYQERNDIQKQINTLRYGVYDAQLKNVAVRAATGDAQAVAQLAQEAGVPYAQTQEGFVPVAMGPDGQWRATGQAMNLEVFANQLYSEASGAAAKRRAAQDTANIEAQKQIAVANQQSANAIMLEMAKGESALQQLLMENRIPKDWKVSRDANNPGAPVIVTNSTGVFEIVPGGVDEATGIQMEGSLRRIQ